MKYFMNSAGIAVIILLALWIALIFNFQETALRLDSFVNTVETRS